MPEMRCWPILRTVPPSTEVFCAVYDYAGQSALFSIEKTLRISSSIVFIVRSLMDKSYKPISALEFSTVIVKLTLIWEAPNN